MARLAAFSLALLIMLFSPEAIRAQTAQPAPSVPASTLGLATDVPRLPPSDLIVTVYQNGIAHVQESRTASLNDRTNRLAFPDLGPNLIPESFRLSADRGGVRVLSFRHERPTLTRGELLRRTLGKELILVRRHPESGKEVEIPATVLSVEGGVVLDVDGRIETLSDADRLGRIVFKSVPPGLRGRSALIARVVGKEPGRHRLRLDYLASGVSWEANYTGHLSEDGTTLSLSAGALVQNGAGTDYTLRQLRLVSGDVQPPQTGRPMAAQEQTLARSAAVLDAAPPPVSVGVAQLYLVPGSVDLPDQSTTQVTLFDTASLPVTERLIARDRPVIWGRTASDLVRSHPDIELEITNDGTELGGAPWPAGQLRVYRQTATQGTVFVGANRLEYVAKGDRAAVTLGRANEVRIERRQTAFKRLDPQGRRVEAAFEVTVLNGAKAPKTIDIREKLDGDWSIVESSLPSERVGSEARWQVSVSPSATTTLTYRVQSSR